MMQHILDSIATLPDYALVILLLAGLALVVFGADWLVDGASSIARRSGISEFVIGLTIVGFGTSCPELVVSVTGALSGHSAIAIGNVLGSNIFNTLLILGLTAVIMPIAITRANLRRDIPITLGVTLLLILCGMSYTLFRLGAGDGISRWEGLMFLCIFALYIWSCFKFDDKSADSMEEQKTFSIAGSVGLVLVGLAGLVVGGKLFVEAATDLATHLGVSDKFIAITVLAGGTSLPELATCVIAAAKKKGQLALGNILGSNVFNILLILGCAAVIRPVSFTGINLVDMGTLLASALLVLLSAFFFKRNEIDRGDGAIFLLGFIAYYIWLFINL